MLALLYVVAVFAVTATVVTVRALLTAPEGFEDQLGFHAVYPPDEDDHCASPDREESKRSPEDMPPFVAAR